MWKREVLMRGGEEHFLSHVRAYCQETGLFALWYHGGTRYRLEPTERLIRMKESAGWPRVAGLPVSRVRYWPEVTLTLSAERATFCVGSSRGEMPVTAAACLAFLALAGYGIVQGFSDPEDGVIGFILALVALVGGAVFIVLRHGSPQDDAGSEILGECISELVAKVGGTSEQDGEGVQTTEAGPDACGKVGQPPISSGE